MPLTAALLPHTHAEIPVQTAVMSPLVCGLVEPRGRHHRHHHRGYVEPRVTIPGREGAAGEETSEK